MVCAVTGAWAAVTVTPEGTTLTIRTDAAGELATSTYSFTDAEKAASKLVLVGKFSDDDLKKVSKNDGGFSNVTEVDLSGATLVDKCTSANTPTGSVSDYSWFKTQEIANASGVQSSTKAIIGPTLYQATAPNTWTVTSETWKTFVLYENNDARDAANVPVGSYAKVPNAFKYCQMTITPEKYSDQKTYGNQGEEVVWAEGERNSHVSDADAPEVVKFYDYYILSGNQWYQQWQSSSKDAYNSAPEGTIRLTAGEGDALNITNDNKDSNKNYDIGTYLRIPYYYEKVYKKEWSDPVDALPDGVTDAVDGKFDVAERNNNKDGYVNGQWVKMYSSYDYYKLTQGVVENGSWNEITDKENVALSYVYPSGTNISDENKTATDGQYAVVGGTEYVFDGTEWNTPGDNTYMVNWEKMQKQDELKSKYWPDATIDDGDYIKWEDGVYKVKVTRPGSLAKKFAALSPKPADGALFRFDSECTGFTAEDLQSLAPQNGPFVYVDLYDVTATPAIETAIEGAINGIISKNSNAYYYKGLLLPKNPDRIGTALILNSKNSPVSEFIAYNSGSTTVAHIYDTQPTNSEPYTTKVTNLNTILNGQPEIATNTSAYLVSTNSKKAISNVTSISETATIVHTYNNEMVNANTSPTEPTILVIPANPNDYATLNSATNIRNTPNTEVLKFSGAISEADILAVNSFTQAHWDNATNSYVENDNPKKYNGPKVLDLSGVPANLITKDLLNNLNNPEIEYIILPAGMDAPVVGDYAYLENLKCVISTDVKSKEGDKVMTAYVREPGSLAEARTYATGEISSNNLVGLKKIKLYGNLRTKDIAKDNNGALYAESSIESIDLTDAVFVKIDADTSEPVVDGAGGYVVDEDCSQMDFSTHKNSNLSQIFLPTDPRMKTIPQNCFEQVDKLSEVCIPINYTKIMSGAFTQTNVCHITTTDSKGNLVDMGENTYILPENLTFIGTHSFDTKSKTVTDVYVQSTIPPVCEKDAFSTEMTWGDGGADFNATNTNGVYCRDVFNNGSIAIAILHFPAQAESGLTAAQYQAMAEKYTDITKVYTKKDQTGAVDANGDPIMWPIQSEFKRSYHQAEQCALWMDPGFCNVIGTDEQGNNVYSIQGSGNNPGEEYKVIEDGRAQNAISDLNNYIGWHQFVLAYAKFMPTEDSDVREYVKDGWHTFCIPYDMTLKDVVELMGVPKSDGKIVNKIVDGENVTLVEDDDILPDIYTLRHVERQLITSTNQGSIQLVLSESLVHEVDGKKMGQFPSYKNNEGVILRNGRDNIGEVEVYEDNGYIGTEPVILRAGYPYLIKPYIRKGESRPYLGQYVMTHHEFPQENSSVMMVDVNGETTVKTTRHHNHCWIDLIQSSDMTTPITRVTSYDGDNIDALKGIEKVTENGKTHDKWSRFAIPYEGHRFKATKLSESNKQVIDGYDNNMVYSFHGNFWKQPLPLNCYYLNTKKATHKWYYYKNYSSSYVWHPYTCILGVGLDVKKDLSTADNLIDEYGSSNILNPIAWDGIGNPVFKRKFQLGYKDLTDDSFEGMSHAREIRIVFDDAITEFGEDGQEITAIESLDGQMLAPVTGKIYNLRGQYVGNSVDGLPKGLYIVNGRKVVVD